ncbi:MAG: glycosyl hydrolase family 17 protein [Ktedonobacteraceae bacterium]
MFQASRKQLILATMPALALVLSLLSAGCSAQVPKISSHPATTSVSKTTACTQAEPVPGQLSLAGLAYGPAHAGQDPTVGVSPSNEEVQADMFTLASLTRYIRTYSSTGSADAIIQAAEAAHVCVASGIELGSDPVANAREMTAGERLASNSAVHAIIVGNEVLARGDLSEEQLRSDIKQVRAKLARAVPITMADTYAQWIRHRDLAKDVDFITVHIYPFGQGISIDSALRFLDQAYTQVQQTFPHKRIVIGETGWPSTGPPYGAAVPSVFNQARYLREFINWAHAKSVQYFYFEAFDEDWKVHEAGVGTHWGLYLQNGEVQPALSDVLPGPASATLMQRSYRDVYVGGLETGFGLGMDSSARQRQWLTANDGSLVLTYPANQQWGVMFITAGPPAPPGHRPSLDMSAYSSLVVDLRAAFAGQCVRIGIKDNNQPDNGSEISMHQCLTTQWSTITLPLNTFTNVDLTHLYVVFELLFQGSSGATVAVRNIRYSPV